MKRIEINLLPKASRLSNLNYLQRVEKIAYIVISIWLVLGISLFGVKAFVTRQVKNLGNEKKKIESLIKDAAPQVGKLQTMRLRLKLAADILKNRNSVNGQFSFLLSLFPDDTIIKSIGLNGKGIEISGVLTGINSLSQLEQNIQQIKNDNKYSLVRLNSLSREGQNLNFSLELKFIQ